MCFLDSIIYTDLPFYHQVLLPLQLLFPLLNSNLTAPTKSRLLVSSNDETSGFTYTAEKNGYVNYTFALSGSNSYAVLEIMKDNMLVNASQLSGCTSAYAQILSLPILKGQKAMILYSNATSNMLYFCEK